MCPYGARSRPQGSPAPGAGGNTPDAPDAPPTMRNRRPQSSLLAAAGDCRAALSTSVKDPREQYSAVQRQYSKVHVRHGPLGTLVKDPRERYSASAAHWGQQGVGSSSGGTVATPSMKEQGPMPCSNSKASAPPQPHTQGPERCISYPPVTTQGGDAQTPRNPCSSTNPGLGGRLSPGSRLATHASRDSALQPPSMSGHGACATTGTAAVLHGSRLGGATSSTHHDVGVAQHRHERRLALQVAQNRAAQREGLPDCRVPAVGVGARVE